MKTNNDNEKFLPIGSVVTLKGAEKRIMIIGFCAISNDQPNITFDYSACLYPEGLLSSEETYLFNHKEIENVDFIGFKTDEETEFKKSLEEVINDDKIEEAEVEDEEIEEIKE